MPTSKMFFLKFILGLNLLTLAACNLPSPKDKTEGGSEAATFTIDSIKGTAATEQTSGAFALPESKVFNFSVCVKDVAYNKTIAGHKFKVAEIDQAVTSDAAGCINWSEKVRYNYLADSQYIEIKRHIQGLGLQKGTREIELGINPWSHGETLPAVVDLRKEQVDQLVTDKNSIQQALKGYGNDNKVRSRKLWVEDGRLFVTEQQMTANGVTLMAEFRGAPSVQLTKMNGEFVLKTLAAGTFKARMSLIHIYTEKNQEVHRLLAQSAEITSSMGNGSLSLKAPISLNAIPTRGQVAFGLELSPVNGPEGLTAFQGFYMMNEYDQIKGTNMLKVASQVAQSKDFKLSDYVNAQMIPTSKAGSNTVEDETYQKPKIEVSQLEYKFIRVGEETTATREVIYSVKACVKSGLDQKTTRAHTFTITKFRQNSTEAAQTVNIKTDNNSCVTWDESIKFKYFDCQRFLKGSVMISNKELGMNETVPMLVNPWETWGPMGRDARYIDPTEKLILDCKSENRPRTQVMLDAYSYNTVSYNYSVDSLFNLTVTKKIQVRMDPHLLVYSSLSNGRSEVQKLRDGTYLLKMAVVKNADYDSKRTVVTYAQKLVTVLTGQINTEVQFQTQDLKALGNRNNMLIEIYPVDESKVQVGKDGQLAMKDAKASLDSAIDKTSQLETPTFMGPVVLNVDEAGRNVRVADASAINKFLLEGKGDNVQKPTIQQIINQGQIEQSERMKNQVALARPATYAINNNLDLITLNTAVSHNTLGALVPAMIGRNPRLLTTKKDLADIVTTGKLTAETAQKLCAFWAQDYLPRMNRAKGGAIQTQFATLFGGDCMSAVKKNPEAFFQVERRMNVKKVMGSRYLQGYNQGLQVGTSFGLSHSKSRTFSQSVGAKAGLSFKFLEFFSVGADAGMTLSWADAQATANGVGVNTSTTMTVQQSKIKVRVGQYEQCAIVKLNPSLFIKAQKSWYDIRRSDYVNILNPALSENETAAAVTRGLMLCEGTDRTLPVDVTENFYLIAQETSSSQMQDNGDDRNRNFFLALRSTKDFEKFVAAVKGNVIMPSTSQAKEATVTDATDMITKMFATGLPTSPGMFRN
ncbi:hypothetical protein ACLSU7_00060 [Bdellovibrio sp. HCB185ZH]|uniref:hypothetical protein n=1 Tax=Bdellovibrio sp. HCB185ZH TaxID=3394235 RepID=UPI0039A753F5